MNYSCHLSPKKSLCSKRQARIHSKSLPSKIGKSDIFKSLNQCIEGVTAKSPAPIGTCPDIRVGRDPWPQSSVDCWCEAWGPQCVGVAGGPPKPPQLLWSACFVCCCVILKCSQCNLHLPTTVHTVCFLRLQTTKWADKKMKCYTLMFVVFWHALALMLVR